jgi:ubiquinone/menaquinone biosynthesis C-methylase UbiE
MNLYVNPEHYVNNNYDVKGRFVSYWHQIYEVLALQPQKVLEVGVGNKFFTSYLRQRDFNVTTLDIDAQLNPDVVGSVQRIPFANEVFDIITCFQLLEHIKYKYFLEALRELHRVSKFHVILSLPDATPVYRIFIELPRIKPIRMMLKHPFPRTATHTYDGHHHWEIGKKDYPLKKIESDIRRAGFRVRNTYRVFEFIYHRFFLLSK